MHDTLTNTDSSMALCGLVQDDLNMPLLVIQHYFEQINSTFLHKKFLNFTFSFTLLFEGRLLRRQLKLTVFLNYEVFSIYQYLYSVLCIHLRKKNFVIVDDINVIIQFYFDLLSLFSYSNIPAVLSCHHSKVVIYIFLGI